MGEATYGKWIPQATEEAALIREPKPVDIGMPPLFEEWREGQWEALQDMVTCPHRFDGNNINTGGGKTGVYMGGLLLALQPGQRGVVLSSTNGLLDQIEEEFGGTIPLISIKGKANYDCTGRPGWTCEDGHNGRCPHKGTEKCEWSGRYFKALTYPIVITNYSFWVSVNRYGQGMGSFDHLVMDEAHAAFDELSNIVQIQLSVHEVEEMLSCGFPDETDDLAIWKAWASPMRKRASGLAKEAGDRILVSRDVRQSHVREFFHYRNLVRKLGTLATIRPANWIVDTWEHGFQFDVIKPSQYAESMLYKKIPRVSLYSATIHDRSMKALGIWEDCIFRPYPSVFDPRGNPVIHVPTVSVNHYMDAYEWAIWLMRADQLIAERLDRRGIFHSVSFGRRDVVMDRSDYGLHGRGLMLSNYRRNGDITSDKVEEFKRTPPPVVLVTPSVSTGYNFKDDDCRYQIHGKIPWPNMRSKLVIARMEHDRWYAANIAMQQLMQACGRARRSNPDWSENLVIDDGFPKFMNRYGCLATGWFRSSVDPISRIPPPMEPPC